MATALQIGDYGLIGDMHTSALVGKDGSIDFMCWPKFDSPSIFARILDTKRGGGGHWTIAPRHGLDQSTVVKQHYLAASNILQTKWIRETGVVDLTDFFGVSKHKLSLRAQYHGSVVARKVECLRGQMTIEINVSPMPGYATQKGALIVGDVSFEENSYRQTLSWSSEAAGKGQDLVVPSFYTAYYPLNHATSTKPRMFQVPNLSNNFINAVFHLEEGDQLFMLMCNPEAAPVLTRELIADLEGQTYKYWTTWIRHCKYRGRFQQEVERSMMILKLLTYEPTGAICAAPTFSLPEAIGGIRNWDYRFSWVRDSSFTVYVFLKMGYPSEAENYMNFIFERIREWRASGLKRENGEPNHLPLMFSIEGETDLPERELPHLGGYCESPPVRIGNDAAHHIQLDIYGELMDAIYLYNKHGKPVSYQQWLDVRYLVDFVCEVWQEPDMSIWEVRGAKSNFTYSKMLLWVAVDRGLRLSDKRNFPLPQRDKWLRESTNLDSAPHKGFIKTFLMLAGTRDALYEEILTKGFNTELNSFVQSYEAQDSLDSSVLIAPLVFFISPTDPQFHGTIEAILKSPEQGGLTSAGFVFRYDTNKIDDGVGGQEGAFVMCTLWLIEAMIRAGRHDTKYLEKAMGMFETVTIFRNHLGMLSEEIAITGEQLGNTPQAFSHLAYVSAAMNLERVTRELGWVRP